MKTDPLASLLEKKCLLNKAKIKISQKKKKKTHHITNSLTFCNKDTADLINVSKRIARSVFQNIAFFVKFQ